MKDSNLLKHFNVWPLRHKNNDPFYSVLLCVRDKGKVRPFAWVDNMGPTPSMRRSLVPLFKPVAGPNILQAVTEITGSESSPEALHEHLLLLAEEKLEKMDQALAKQNRRYRNSVYADANAAMLCRPGLGTKKYRQLLDMHYQGLTSEDEASDWFDKPESLHKTKAWTWSDYKEHPDMTNLMNRLILNGTPLPILENDLTQWPRLAEEQRQLLRRLPEERDDRRIITPKARLTYVKSLAYQLINTRPFPAMKPYPFPMTDMTDMQIGKLSDEHMTQLLADCHTWVSFYCVMDHAHERGGTRPISRHWIKSGIEKISMCTFYHAENNRVVEGDPMIHHSITELPALAKRFGIHIELPVREVKIQEEPEGDEWERQIAIAQAKEDAENE